MKSNLNFTLKTTSTMDFLALAVVLLSATCLSLGIRTPWHGKGLTVPLGRLNKNSGEYSLEKIKKTFSRAGNLRNGGDVTLEDVQDIYYYGEMGVGTPPQNINVLFDTGSADLWVPSTAICKRQRKYCRHHNTYTDTKSTTFKKNGTKFSIQYGSGLVSGFVSQDNILVAGLPVTGQTFGEATAVDKFTATAEFDGIFGLAYTSLSEMGVNPPFVNMIQQKVVEDPVFAFYLNKDEPSSADNRYSSTEPSTGSAELVLGGVDPAHYTGDFTYTPVTDKSYWVIDIDSISLAKKTITTSISGVPDSGTSLLVGPSEVTDPINEALGGTPDEGIYVVDCSTINNLPDVTFTIANTRFVLHPQEYIVKVAQESGSDETVCISSLVGNDLMPFFILGDVFMRKYYTVFDMGKDRVGFALAQ